MITRAASLKFMPHCVLILVAARPLYCRACDYNNMLPILYLPVSYRMPLMVVSNTLSVTIKEVSGGCVFDASQECVHVFTFSQDLWDLGVAGAEGAVDLEAIGIIQE